MTDWLSTASTTFFLIGLAEFGDKSQLVCMTLAARHRGLPVALGAVASFAILNLLAVLFGATASAWLPTWVITLIVAALFAYFGIAALRYEDESDDATIDDTPKHGIFVTTFLMIFVAEFGDKTQLAVAGMGSTTSPIAVWAGATLALTCTSVIAVIAGRKFLHRLPLRWIHRISGSFFLLLAAVALTRLI